MPAVADPFAELVPQNLIGGENGAPAFQTVGGQFQEVPKAEVNTPTELGAFADLVPADAPSARSMDFGPFTDLVPQSPTSETEKALAETPVFNPLDEQISAAPTFFGELQAGRLGSAYHLAKEFVGTALEPTQKIEPGRGKGLLGTEEQIPADPNDSLPVRAAKAFINVTNRTAANLTGPGMLPLAVIGGVGGLASKALAAGFGTQMLAGAPETWKAIQEADKTEPWSQQRFEAGLDTVMQALMLAGAAKHATAMGETPVRPTSASGDIPAPERGAVPEAQSDNPARRTATAEETPQGDASISAAGGGADVVPPATELQGNDWTRATEEPVVALFDSPSLAAPETQNYGKTQERPLTETESPPESSSVAPVKASAPDPVVSQDSRLRSRDEFTVSEVGDNQNQRIIDRIDELEGAIGDAAEKQDPASGPIRDFIGEMQYGHLKSGMNAVEYLKKLEDAAEKFGVKPKIQSEGQRLKLKHKDEAGFVNLQGAADAIDTAKEKTGLNIGGKADDLNLATAARSAKLQESFADAERAQKEIRKAVPDEKRQGAISLYIESAGDQNVLATWASQAKGKMFKEAVEAARNLKPAEVAVAQKVGQTFGVLEQRGNKYDVLNAHRDNYVPHEWDVTKNFSGIGSSKLKDSFKFNKARTFNNFFEGDQAGFTPKTLAIGKLLPAYLHEMNTVIADRQFIQDAAKGKASDGTPLLIPRGRVSTVEKASGGKATLADPHAIHGMKDAAGNPIDQRAYKVISDQPALSDWRWEGKDAAGNPVFMRDDLAAHPELADRLDAMMGDSFFKKWYNKPSKGTAVIPRAIVKGLDTAQSVMKREMFGLLAPFHMVQEATHAIGHTINPFFGLEKMDRPTPEMIDGMQHGLMLKPEKSGGGSYMEGVGASKTFASQITRKFGGKAGQIVADTIDGYQNYLFHQYIPALKWKTYQHVVERNLKRYAKDLMSGEVTPGDVKMLSAEQVNAAYGHLNYALLDRSPTFQHILQLGLLAPDFLEARGRFVGQAMKSVASKSGHEQFRAIAVLAAAQAGTAYTFAKLLGGEWDPRHPFEMTYNGRTYTLRSVPEDLMRLLAFMGGDSNTTREFVSARINPMTQKGIQSVTGRNYRGEKTTFTETMGELLANYIPITARQIPGIRELTETSRNSPTSPLEQLAGSLGLKISRHSPIQKTYQLANQWKKDTGLPADTGSYPVSRYQQLRYALEDGDFDKARTEYDKLISAGEKKAKIGPGFKESVMHPFSGSQANDAKFRKSLGADDRVMFDAAVKRRHEILQRFGRLH